MFQGQPSSDRRLGSAVKRLQLALRVAAADALADRDLSMAQSAVLQVLAGCGPLSCAELARRCFITRQSIQDVIKALHSRGLIEKGTDPNHARHVMLALSAAGRQAAQAASDIIWAIEDQMTEGLTPRERTRMLSWINACVDKLHRLPARDNSLSTAKG